MASRRSVPIRIRGKEFRVVTEGDDAALQRVAALVDQTMARVEKHTGAIDTLDVTMLTALNLARELIALRERDATPDFDGDRLRALVLRAESALQG